MFFVKLHSLAANDLEYSNSDLANSYLRSAEGVWGSDDHLMRDLAIDLLGYRGVDERRYFPYFNREERRAARLYPRVGVCETWRIRYGIR